MFSTRTELRGSFAAITYLRLVVEFYHVALPNDAKCWIHCDSKAALSIDEELGGTSHLAVPHSI
jgi:hypothetical protein